MNHRKLAIFAVALVMLCLGSKASEILKDTTGRVELKYEKTNNGIDVELKRDGKVKLTGKLGVGKNLENVSCIGQELCTFGNNEQLLIKPREHGFKVTWTTLDVVEDCYNLYSNTTNWYGGPEQWEQVWPIEKLIIDGAEPYVVRRSKNSAVAERYWLSSDGIYLVVNEETPLWVDQNNKYQDQVCFTSDLRTPYLYRESVDFTTYIGLFGDPRSGHLDVVNTLLGKPTAHPNEKIIAEPIWTTWGKYKKPINDSTVLEFANDIRSHGYTGGQLEIDDNWETCYGSQEFDPKTFGNISNTIATLHKDNWRVSLWIHPFVNNDCQNNSQEGQALDYFVKNSTGHSHAEWWNGNDAHQIDFTKPEAAEWWSARLRKLQANIGIDSFKFDAGETDYANQPNIYEDVKNAPNILTQKYIEACVEFGDLIEVRSSFRGQQYGELIRMIDKDSRWGNQNGLSTLITTLLQLNINGYVMVLPDLIGGNGYGEPPTAELLVRWTQANTFMPTMQFSYLPWDLSDIAIFDTEAIVKKYVDLHAQYAPNILKAMNQSITNGDPVNPPIWWVDPTDPIALASGDEYLLGEEILVAPVIVEGAVSRDVYLPKGQWKDGNNGTVYTGPINLVNYPAPIEVLPYFIKQ